MARYPGETIQSNFRLTAADLSHLDYILSEMSMDRGRLPTRTDALRLAIQEAADARRKKSLKNRKKAAKSP